MIRLINFHEFISQYINQKVFSFDTSYSFLAGLVRNKVYHVTQQCCPGGNRPETPRRPSAGGLLIFGAKLLVIPTIYTKFKLTAHKFKLEFCINGWNYQ